MALIVLPPILLLWFIICNRSKITNEISSFNCKNNIELILYSTAFAFIGFNLISSLTTRYFEMGISLQFPVNIPILYIYSITFSPIIEEYICRGYVFKKLSSKLGFTVSALLSSMVFAIPHFNPSAFLGYVFVGFVWCWYYKKSGTLIVPILSHALFNFVTILIISMKG